MPELELATPPVESVPQESGSQATEPTPQGAVQPQETGHTQVESVEPSASSTPAERPRASDYVKQRQEMRALRNQVAQMESILKQKSSEGKPQPPKINAQEFYDDPVNFMLKREEQLREQIRKEILEDEFPQRLDRYEQTKLFKVKEQEAMELLFPKASPADTSSVEDRIGKDPVRAEALLGILKDEAFIELQQKYPAKAAKWALFEYEKLISQQPKTRNPNAPTKAQMASTATGTPLGGGKKMPTLDELKTEVNAMQARASDRPELRFDDKFKERWNYLKDELAKLSKGS